MTDCSKKSPAFRIFQVRNKHRVEYSLPSSNFLAYKSASIRNDPIVLSSPAGKAVVL